MSGDYSLSAGIELLGHDVRAAILVVLAEHKGTQPRDDTLRFAELRDRVGHDDPGNFNYHLQRLVGSLVEKTDEGYRLSDVGHHLVGVLRSGQFDPERRLAVRDAETSCPVCGTTATITYEDGSVRTTCEEDHTSILNVGPGLLESHSITEALSIAIRRTLWESKSMMEGVCPYCDGQTTGTVRRLPAGPIPVLYEWTCRKCGALTQNSAGGCVLFHPAVIEFYYRQGIDVFSGTWDLFVETVGTATIRETDPLRVQVDLAVDGKRLELTLDDAATVIDVATGDR